METDGNEDAMEDAMEMYLLAASPQGSPTVPVSQTPGIVLNASNSQTSFFSASLGAPASEAAATESVDLTKASPKLLKAKGEEKLEAFRLQTEHAPQLHRKKVYVMKMDDALGPRWVSRWQTLPGKEPVVIKSKAGAHLHMSQVHLGSQQSVSTPNLLKQI
jgi:hypothetical protein